MNNRITQTLQTLKMQQRKALIPFVMAGDPQLEMTVPLMHHLVANGADLIEIGVPFSDPVADGPIIQAAGERALAQNIGLTQVLQMVAEFRTKNTHTPIILMGYLNPIEMLGEKKFATAAQAAGVDGLIAVDLSPEESHDFHQLLTHHQIALIFLVAPTTTDARLQMIAKLAQGFLYFVSLKGVTGVKAIDTTAVAPELARIRKFTDLPLCVGFGINDATSAAAVGQVAEGVIIGSALIKAYQGATTKEEVFTRVHKFLTPIRMVL